MRIARSWGIAPVAAAAPAHHARTATKPILPIPMTSPQCPPASPPISVRRLRPPTCVALPAGEKIAACLWVNRGCAQMANARWTWRVRYALLWALSGEVRFTSTTDVASRACQVRKVPTGDRPSPIFRKSQHYSLELRPYGLRWLTMTVSPISNDIRSTPTCNGPS